MEQRSLTPSWMQDRTRAYGSRAPPSSRPGSATGPVRARTSSNTWKTTAQRRANPVTSKPQVAALPFAKATAASTKQPRQRVVVATLPSARARQSEQSTPAPSPANRQRASQSSVWGSVPTSKPTVTPSATIKPPASSAARANRASLTQGRGVANIGWMNGGASARRTSSRKASPSTSHSSTSDPALPPSSGQTSTAMLAQSSSNVSGSTNTTPEPGVSAGSSSTPTPDTDNSTACPKDSESCSETAISEPITIATGSTPPQSDDQAVDDMPISQSLEAETRFLRDLGWDGSAVPEEDDSLLTTDEIAAFRQTADQIHSTHVPPLRLGVGGLDGPFGLGRSSLLNELDDDSDSSDTSDTDDDDDCL
eukprot:TRINITY_DN2302_c0_g2_i1.p1 TRINITY_DN2302_c0_g2~~TRINITY_DN2302_c0_g2_i1.p1  ORF type:complete len:366 (+),score=80.82 TRINITY_DN2302_c0_g2_i1:316-1413(+)